MDDNGGVCYFAESFADSEGPAASEVTDGCDAAPETKETEDGPPINSSIGIDENVTTLPSEEVVESKPPLSEELEQGYRILRDIMTVYKSVAWPFMEPVDAEKLELWDYYDRVKKPMWLKKMREKFENREYNSITDFVADFRLMLENCFRYNGPDHPISKRGTTLETILEQKLALLSRELRDKTSVAATSGEQDAFVSITSSRKRRVASSRISSKLLNQLREEEAIKEKESRKQQMLERKQAQEAYIEMLQNWEDGLLADPIRKILNTSWEIPQIGLFLFLCQEVLNIGEVMQYELERSFAMARESMVMQTVMTSLLSTPYQRTRLDKKPLMPYKVWEDKLRVRLRQWYKVLKDCGKDQPKAADKIGIEDRFFKVVGTKNPLEKKKYHELTFYQKVWVMKGLCDYSMTNQESLWDAMDAQQVEETREYLLGYDAEGNSYIHFPQFCGADVRIFKQAPLPMPSLKVEKPKPSPKKVQPKKTGTPKKKKKKSSTPARRPSRLRQTIKYVLQPELSGTGDNDEESEQNSDIQSDSETTVNSSQYQESMDQESIIGSIEDTQPTVRARRRDRQQKTTPETTPEITTNEPDKVNGEEVFVVRGPSHKRAPSPPKPAPRKGARRRKNWSSRKSKKPQSNNSEETNDSIISDTSTHKGDGDCGDHAGKGKKGFLEDDTAIHSILLGVCTQDDTESNYSLSSRTSVERSLGAGDTSSIVSNHHKENHEAGLEENSVHEEHQESIEIKTDIIPTGGDKGKSQTECSKNIHHDSNRKDIDFKMETNMDANENIDIDKYAIENEKDSENPPTSDNLTPYSRTEATGDALDSSVASNPESNSKSGCNCVGEEFDKDNEPAIKAALCTAGMEAEESDEDDGIEIEAPDADEFRMVVSSVEQLRTLCAQFEEVEPITEGSGKRMKIIKPPPRKRCVIELHDRLTYLLSELEPWEHKLIQANKKAKTKLRKEQEEYEEEISEVEDVWDSEEPVSESSEDEDSDDDDDETQSVSSSTARKQPRDRKKAASSAGEKVADEDLYDISSRGRVRKRRLIPNNTEDQGVKKAKTSGVSALQQHLMAKLSKPSEETSPTPVSLIQNRSILQYLINTPPGSSLNRPIAGTAGFFARTSTGQQVFISLTTTASATKPTQENLIQALVSNAKPKTTLSSSTTTAQNFTPYHFVLKSPSNTTAASGSPATTNVSWKLPRIQAVKEQPGSSLVTMGTNLAMTQASTSVASLLSTPPTTTTSEQTKVSFYQHNKIGNLPPHMIQSLLKSQAVKIDPASVSSTQGQVVTAATPMLQTAAVSDAQIAVSPANTSEALSGMSGKLQHIPTQSTVTSPMNTGLLKLATTPPKQKYAGNVTVKALLENRAHQKGTDVGLVQIDHRYPQLVSAESSLTSGPTQAQLASKLAELSKSLVIETAVKAVTTSVNTTLPTAQMKVPCPLTMPTIQPRRNVTQVTQATKGPIPTSNMLSSHQTTPVKVTQSLSQQTTIALTVGDGILATQTSPVTQQAQGGGQKNVLVKLLPQSGSTTTTHTTPQGPMQAILTPQGILIPHQALQQNVPIQNIVAKLNQLQKQGVLPNVALQAVGISPNQQGKPANVPVQTLVGQQVSTSSGAIGTTLAPKASKEPMSTVVSCEKGAVAIKPDALVRSTPIVNPKVVQGPMAASKKVPAHTSPVQSRVFTLQPGATVPYQPPAPGVSVPRKQATAPAVAIKSPVKNVVLPSTQQPQRLVLLNVGGQYSDISLANIQGLGTGLIVQKKTPTKVGTGQVKNAQVGVLQQAVRLQTAVQRPISSTIPIKKSGQPGSFGGQQAIDIKGVEKAKKMKLSGTQQQQNTSTPIGCITPKSHTINQPPAVSTLQLSAGSASSQLVQAAACAGLYGSPSLASPRNILGNVSIPLQGQPAPTITVTRLPAACISKEQPVSTKGSVTITPSKSNLWKGAKSLLATASTPPQNQLALDSALGSMPTQVAVLSPAKMAVNSQPAVMKLQSLGASSETVQTSITNTTGQTGPLVGVSTTFSNSSPKLELPGVTMTTVVTSVTQNNMQSSVTTDSTGSDVSMDYSQSNVTAVNLSSAQLDVTPVPPSSTWSDVTIGIPHDDTSPSVATTPPCGQSTVNLKDGTDDCDTDISENNLVIVTDMSQEPGKTTDHKNKDQMNGESKTPIS